MFRVSKATIRQNARNRWHWRIYQTCMPFLGYPAPTEKNAGVYWLVNVTDWDFSPYRPELPSNYNRRQKREYNWHWREIRTRAFPRQFILTLPVHIPFDHERRGDFVMHLERTLGYKVRVECQLHNSAIIVDVTDHPHIMSFVSEPLIRRALVPSSDTGTDLELYDGNNDAPVLDYP